MLHGCTEAHSHALWTDMSGFKIPHMDEIQWGIIILLGGGSRPQKIIFVRNAMQNGLMLYAILIYPDAI